MSLKKLLESPNIHFILFGGKGGVGKTSCATAAAIWAADHGKKVLIISTDPAHSLADSLGCKLDPGEITQVQEVNDLWAMELKPKVNDSEMGQLMNQAPPELSSMLGGMGNLVGDLNGMTPPGMDEAMAFGKVLEYLRDTEYDLIIFDTAPTGHTLRLLSIPDMLSGWMGKILTMKLKLGKLFAGFKGLFGGSGENPDADALDSLKKLKEAIEDAKVDLSDPEKTSFVVIMIAEVMAIYETERLLRSLIDYQIPVKYMVVNQVVPESSKCEFCQNRRTMQFKHLKEIRQMYSEDYEICEVPLFPEEIRKVNQLRVLASILMKEEEEKEKKENKRVSIKID